VAAGTAQAASTSSDTRGRRPWRRRVLLQTGIGGFTCRRPAAGGRMTPCRFGCKALFFSRFVLSWSITAGTRVEGRGHEASSGKHHPAGQSPSFCFPLLTASTFHPSNRALRLAGSLAHPSIHPSIHPPSHPPPTHHPPTPTRMLARAEHARAHAHTASERKVLQASSKRARQHAPTRPSPPSAPSSKTVVPN
jgi:hypothetical protein